MSMTAVPPSEEEAMILPLGAPMDADNALFQGPLAAARDFIEAMAPEERAEVAIWTPGHIFTADQLLTEAPGHEHDPLHDATA